MPLDGRQRRALASQGNRIKATIALRTDDLSESVVQHLRSALLKHPLLKVRLAGDDRAARDRFAAELAARVPCELVRRIGRVALLYRQPSDPPAARSAE